MAKPQTTKPARKTAGKTPDWLPGELVYRVIGYLSSRRNPIIFTRDHDMAPVAHLIGEILKANGIKSSDRNYPELIIPEGLEGITNVPDQVKLVAPAPKRLDNPAQILEEILMILRGYLDLNGQNQLLAALIREMQKDRENRVKVLQLNSKEIAGELDSAYKTGEDFAKVLSGNL